MSLYNISHEEMQKIIAELQQALYNHQQWYNELIRTLVCRLPSDKHDLSSEAHKECRFGQWYYDQRHKDLENHPGFIAVGEQHKRMHQAATSLLNASNVGVTTHTTIVLRIC